MTYACSACRARDGPGSAAIYDPPGTGGVNREKGPRMLYEVDVNPARLPAAARDAILTDPGFGNHFTDHMVLCRWTVADGWGPLRVLPYGELTMSPAAMGIHYGQSVFEGLKVYRRADGSHGFFRPERNAARMRHSAARLAMPEPPEELFLAACALLAEVDRAWVPPSHGSSLYLRPWMFATEEHIGVRPAEEYLFGVLACPVAPIFSADPVPISIRVELDDVRAAAGGTGDAKFAGNYAAALRAHARAKDAGYDQVLWLDAAEHRWVEEINGMNIMFVWDRGGHRPLLTTPPLTGTVLAGVTRDAILTMAASLGCDVREQPTLLDEVCGASTSGELSEVFACGTAAVVAPIGRLSAGARQFEIGGGVAGDVTLRLRQELLDLQHGLRVDEWGWTRSVADVLAAVGVDGAPAGADARRGG